MANTLRICLATLTALLLIAPTSVEARQIALAWDANLESSVTGYTLSYGTQPGIYTTSANVGNLISYMIDLPGAQYYFVIRAYTAAGLISPMSAEVAESSVIALTNPGPQTDAAGFSVSVQLAATGTPVSYTATNLPGGLSSVASTGRISGIISSGAAASSPYLVSASVSNAVGNKSSVQFTWSIVANNAPSLTSPGNQTSAANATTSLQLAATDPDGDALTYSATWLPPALTVNGSTGLISGTLSSTAGTYSVTATASDGLLTNSKTFTWTVTGVSQTPSVTNLAPASGLVGTSVTITGTNFGATKGTSTVTFNGTLATSPTTWTATSIAVPVPAGATSGNVVVTVGGMASNGVAFTVVPTSTAPTVTSLAPTSGAVGASVTITGTDFGSTKGTSTITFNGITGAPATWTATSIAVPVPAGATSGNVIITVGGLASNAVAFTVIPRGHGRTKTSAVPPWQEAQP